MSRKCCDMGTRSVSGRPNFKTTTPGTWKLNAAALQSLTLVKFIWGVKLPQMNLTSRWCFSVVGPASCLRTGLVLAAQS